MFLFSSTRYTHCVLLIESKSMVSAVCAEPSIAQGLMRFSQHTALGIGGLNNRSSGSSALSECKGVSERVWLNAVLRLDI